MIMIKKRLGVQIVTSRRDYLGVLLSSLLRQTFDKWDLFLVFQDQSIVKDHMVANLLARATWEGHRVRGIYTDTVQGIGNLRNLALNEDDCEYGVRIDDDSWCEPDYFELLMKVIKKEKKAGCVGGIVPSVSGERLYKELKDFGWMNEFGDMDESCFTGFFNVKDGTYIPVKHLRSSFMYRNERAVEIGGFPTEYDQYAGFREETDFCLRMGQKYQSYFVPHAINWHFAAPTGGTRELWAQLGPKARQQADTLFRRKFYGKI